MMSVVSKAFVKSVESFGDDVKKFTLKVGKLESFESGQFLQLTLENFNGSGNWPESRAFSIANYSNDQNEIELIIKKVGAYTQLIFDELHVGTYCTIKYAYGDFLLPMFDQEAKIHAIAGGTGLAPFLSFAQQLKAEFSTDNFHLYYSVSHAKEFVSLDLLSSILHQENLHLFCTREQVDYAFNRRIDIKDVLRNVQSIDAEYFYLCGSKSLISNFNQLLKDNGAKKIVFEDWS